MPNDKGGLIHSIVDAFKDLVTFTEKKWWATLKTTVYVVLVVFIGIYAYRLYANVAKNTEIISSKNTTPQQQQEGLKASVQDSMMIDRTLTEVILNSQNGSNALFFKFHDSKVDLSGKHDYFYSAMNEITRPEHKSIIGNLQNIPITGMGQYMVPFLNNKCQTVATEDISANAWLKGRLEADEILRLAACPVYDSSDKFLLGFVELVYTEPHGQVRPINVVEDCLKLAAVKISAIISRPE